MPSRTPRGEIKIPDPTIDPTNNAIPLIKLNLGFSSFFVSICLSSSISITKINFAYINSRKILTFSTNYFVDFSLGHVFFACYFIDNIQTLNQPLECFIFVSITQPSVHPISYALLIIARLITSKITMKSNKRRQHYHWDR